MCFHLVEIKEITSFARGRTTLRYHYRFNRILSLNHPGENRFITVMSSLLPLHHCVYSIPSLIRAGIEITNR